MATRWTAAIVFALVASIGACGDDDRGGATSPLTQGANDVSCDRGVTLCRNGDLAVCVDLRKSSEHCGDCNHPCAGETSCREGECLAEGEKPQDHGDPTPTSCPPGRTMCGGSCVDTLRDALHCGACDSICGSNSKCRDGSCATDE